MEASGGNVYPVGGAAFPESANDGTCSGLSLNGSDEGQDRRIFVGGLWAGSTSESLSAYFSNYGPLAGVKVIMDPDSGRSRRYGFVQFKDPTSVARVLVQPSHYVDGMWVHVSAAIRKTQDGMNGQFSEGMSETGNAGGASGRSNMRKIFVGGISQETGEEDFRRFFSKLGRLESIELVQDPTTGRHRGFGFIVFESENVTDRVCEKRFYTLKGKKVECKRERSAYRFNRMPDGASGGQHTFLPRPDSGFYQHARAFPPPIDPASMSQFPTQFGYGYGQQSFLRSPNPRYSPYPYHFNQQNITASRGTPFSMPPPYMTTGYEGFGLLSGAGHDAVRGDFYSTNFPAAAPASSQGIPTSK